METYFFQVTEEQKITLKKCGVIFRSGSLNDANGIIVGKEEVGCALQVLGVDILLRKKRTKDGVIPVVLSFPESAIPGVVNPAGRKILTGQQKFLEVITQWFRDLHIGLVLHFGDQTVFEIPDPGEKRIFFIFRDNVEKVTCYARERRVVLPIHPGEKDVKIVKQEIRKNLTELLSSELEARTILTKERRQQEVLARELRVKALIKKLGQAKERLCLAQKEVEDLMTALEKEML